MLYVHNFHRMRVADKVQLKQFLWHIFRYRLVECQDRQSMAARFSPPGMPTGDVHIVGRHQRTHSPDHTRLVKAAQDEQVAFRHKVHTVLVDLDDMRFFVVEQRPGHDDILAVLQVTGTTPGWNNPPFVTPSSV